MGTEDSFMAARERLSKSAFLVIDDEDIIVDVMREVVGPLAAAFESARSGEEGLRKLAKRGYDFILLDIKMPGMNGMELYGNIRRYFPHFLQRVIFMTGDTQSEETAAFIAFTGRRCLIKPFDIKEFFGILNETERSLSHGKDII
ncbi:MAG: response regulator [Deltaproteobacteria bacterium]|nr:response regulator [Deltaproteobacteria bacterium]